MDVTRFAALPAPATATKLVDGGPVISMRPSERKRGTKEHELAGLSLTIRIFVCACLFCRTTMY